VTELQPNPPSSSGAAPGGPSRACEPCAGCGSPVATRHAAPGGPVWLCPPCAATADLGCP